MKRERVGEVLVEAEIDRRTLPFDVRAGAEARPLAGQDDDACVADLRERLVQPCDQRGVEGIAAFGPGQGDAQDGPVTFDVQHAPSLSFTPFVQQPRRPTAIAAAATVVALVSAWHSGRHMWHRLGHDYRTYAAMTDLNGATLRLRCWSWTAACSTGTRSTSPPATVSTTRFCRAVSARMDLPTAVGSQGASTCCRR